jgi:hypothetical protein
MFLLGGGGEALELLGLGLVHRANVGPELRVRLGIADGRGATIGAAPATASAQRIRRRYLLRSTRGCRWCEPCHPLVELAPEGDAVVDGELDRHAAAVRDVLFHHSANFPP